MDVRRHHHHQNKLFHWNTGSQTIRGMTHTLIPQVERGDIHPKLATRATILGHGPGIGRYPKNVNSYGCFELNVELMNLLIAKESTYSYQGIQDTPQGYCSELFNHHFIGY